MTRLAFGIVIFGIGLFALLKPVHIDDPVVLHVAQNILKDPLRPFAGVYFWLEEPQPLAKVTTNPPLVSYWLAPWVAIGGYREWLLHLSFAPFVALLVWGMYRLTARFLGQEWAWWGVGWVLLSPAVLPGMNLMRDVPAFALFVGGLACWVEGLAQNDRRYLIAGALLGGLSGLAKYTALFWIPLALIYTVQQGAWRQLGWLGLSLLPITLWSAMNLWADGEMHLIYLWQERRGSAPWAAKFLPGVVGLGASLLLVWGLLPRWRSTLGNGRAWKSLLIALCCSGLVYWHITLFEGRPIYAQTLFWLVSGGVLLGAALACPHLSPPSHGVGEGGQLPDKGTTAEFRVRTRNSIFSALTPLPPLPRRGRGGATYAAHALNSPLPPSGRGAGGEGNCDASPPHAESGETPLATHALNSPLPRRGRGAGGEGTVIFLRLWLLLALITAVWGVPFQAMRHLLYALPPIVLLLTPLVGKRPSLLLLQGVLSMAVIVADYDYAIRYKRTTDYFAELFAGERMWYVGSWGWMFYAEQQGFRKLLPSAEGLQRGDVILVPQRVYKGKMPADFERNATLINERVCPPLLPLRTMDFEGAAYYAIIRTNAPFRFTLDYETPLEVTRAYRWSPPH